MEGGTGEEFSTNSCSNVGHQRGATGQTCSVFLAEGHSISVRCDGSTSYTCRLISSTPLRERDAHSEHCHHGSSLLPFSRQSGGSPLRQTFAFRPFFFKGNYKLDRESQSVPPPFVLRTGNTTLTTMRSRTSGYTHHP